ncbi:MAG: protein translocase subunit SecD [Planctomycetota bacterium]
MSSQNRLLKWALVIVPIVAAGLAIYPPQNRLKGGIDLVGGTSLLYEIDTAGMKGSEASNLSGRVMNILQRRVDPNGQLNLVWRPVGNTRLEIQMPRPPKEVLERREAYKAALAKLQAKNITRVDIELALNSPEAEWQAWVAEQARIVPERGPKLEALKQAHDAYRKVQSQVDADLAEEQAAEAGYDTALADVEWTVLPLGRLEDVLALRNPKEREKELTDLKTRHSAYAVLIDEVRKEYDVWSRNKGTLEDPSDLKRRISGAGVLEFRILAERDPTNPGYTQSQDPNLRQPIADYVEKLHLHGPRLQAGEKYGWFPIENVGSFMFSLRDKDISEFEKVKDQSTEIVEKYAGGYYVLMHTEPEYGLLHLQKGASWKLVRAYPMTDPNTGRPAVSFTLDPRGGRFFGELTRKNIKRQLAILLDGAAMSHATIQSQINESGQITGDFTLDKVKELVTVLEAGSLPARLKETPLMEYTVGPSLGKYNRDQGMHAAAYSLVAVVIFMALYYLVSGVVADIAVLLNLLFTLAIMAMLQATFTLPGIAGMILTVGMAVDANVLIMERFREERARGVPLKKAVKLGYERAFSAIFDGNLTTLITAVILGYVGSEEVKGFAMTLGFGLCTSMFTALFVTRLLLNTLIDLRLVKDLPMLRLIRTPNIDWLRLRWVFWPASLAIMIAGGAFFVIGTLRNKEALYDIEFLGGTSVQLELKPGINLSDEEVRQRITSTAPNSAASWLRSAADHLVSAKLGAGPTAGRFTLQCEGLTPEQVGALIRTTFENKLARNGLSGEGNLTVVDTKAEAAVTLESFTAAMQEAAAYARRAAENLATAKIQTVAALEGEAASSGGLAYELVTVETAKDLVQTAIMAVLGQDLAVERPIEFAMAANPQTGLEYFPIEREIRYLEDLSGWEKVVGEAAHFDVQRYKGGVALVFNDLTPPQTLTGLEKRIREIRLLPEFEGFQWRDYKLFGLGAGATTAGEPAYHKFAMVVVDPNVPCDEDLVKWEQLVAKTELEQAKLALGSEKSLRKVVQFAPTVAATARAKALQAILLSLTAIVAYIWFRFRNVQFGLGAIVALVHDVVVPLGLMTLLDVLGVASIRIDMAVIAAFLTITGYSVNDTIVIFDRIRENRGKHTRLSAAMINQSLNETLSRTILTSFTVFLTVFIMLVWGGPGLYGFAFAMTIGVVSGSYSTLAIAVPLVYRPKVLHSIVYILIALALFGTVAMLGTQTTLLMVVGGILAVLMIGAIMREVRADRSRLAPTAT